jgi:hypothetical protein
MGTCFYSQFCPMSYNYLKIDGFALQPHFGGEERKVVKEILPNGQNFSSVTSCSFCLEGMMARDASLQ